MKFTFILLVLLFQLKLANNCGCGDSSSGDKGKGMGGLATLMIAMLLTQQGSGIAAASSPVRELPNLLQQVNSGVPIGLASKLHLVAKVKALRQQHGFGFLWGKKRARVLKTVAEEINNSSRNAAPQAQPAKRNFRLGIWPWKHSKSVLGKGNSTRTSKNGQGREKTLAIKSNSQLERIRENMKKGKYSNLFNRGFLFMGGLAE